MKNNKLIAEFMGLSIKEGVDVFKPGNIYHHIRHLPYHTSWDWLMPVLSKILDLSFQDDGDAEDFYSIRDCVPDINHTYKAVVEFIKEQNNDNNK